MKDSSLICFWSFLGILPTGGVSLIWGAGPLGPPGTRTQVDQVDQVNLVNLVNLDPGVQVHLVVTLVRLAHLVHLEPGPRIPGSRSTWWSPWSAGPLGPPGTRTQVDPS